MGVTPRPDRYPRRVMTGQEFRQARLTMGLSQKELGNMMGVAQPHVARIESGATVTATTAAFVALLLWLHQRGLLRAYRDTTE